MFFKQSNSVLLQVLLLTLAGWQFQCHRPVDCREAVYNFELGLKAYPDKDSIHIGDSLWLEVNESTTFTDVRTGRVVDYSGAANLGSAIGFQQLSNSSSQFSISAAQKFDFSLVQGVEAHSADPTLYHEYLFTEVNGAYGFKLGIVPREAGIYSIVFSNAANVFRKDDNCTKANFTLNFKNTNQHYNLNPNFQSRPVPAGGDYYFKVN